MRIQKPATKEEWDFAKSAVQNLIDVIKNENIQMREGEAIKIPRKLEDGSLNGPLEHSFFYVHDLSVPMHQRLYCADSTVNTDDEQVKNVYNKGSKTKVKKVVREDGFECILHILLRQELDWYQPKRQLINNILKYRNYFYGECERILNKPKAFFKKSLLSRDYVAGQQEYEGKYKYYTLMEDGGLDLVNYINEIPLSAAQVKIIIVLICKELQIYHRLGLIHNDVKPENLGTLISPTDPLDIRVMLYDLEAAEHVTKATPFLKNKKIHFTDRWASIEIINGIRITKKSDLIALGRVLFCFRDYIDRFSLEPEILTLIQKLVPPLYNSEDILHYSEDDVDISLPDLITLLRNLNCYTPEIWSKTCNNPKKYRGRLANYLLDTIQDVLDAAAYTKRDQTKLGIALKKFVDENQYDPDTQQFGANKTFPELIKLLENLLNAVDASAHLVNSKEILIMLAKEIKRDKMLFSDRSIFSIDIHDVMNIILEGLKKMQFEDTIICITAPRCHSTSLLMYMRGRNEMQVEENVEPEDREIFHETGVRAFNEHISTAEGKEELTKELFKNGIATFEEVTKTIEETATKKKVFLKEVIGAAKYYLKDAEIVKSPNTKIVFIIRDPADFMISNNKILGSAIDKNLREFWSIEDQLKLYEQIKSVNPNTFILHAQELIDQPDVAIQRYCKFTNLPYRPAGLQWKPADQQKQYQYCGFVRFWQEDAAKSTGFNKGLAHYAIRDEKGNPTFAEVKDEHRDGFKQFYEEQMESYNKFMELYNKQNAAQVAAPVSASSNDAKINRKNTK